MVIKAIIFDMDGLMFDTERITAQLWVQVGEALGFPITRELAMSVIGMRDMDTRMRFAGIFGPGLDYDKAVRMRLESMYSFIDEHGVPAKKGLYSLLDELAALGIRAALASSTEKERVMYLLEGAGIADRFEAIVAGDMVKRGKPEPDVFLLAGKLLCTAPESCLVLEDSPYGITAAHRAGMPVIMVPDMLAPTKETDAMTLATVSSLDDVIPIIRAGVWR